MLLGLECYYREGTHEKRKVSSSYQQWIIYVIKNALPFISRRHQPGQECSDSFQISIADIYLVKYTVFRGEGIDVFYFLCSVKQGQEADNEHCSEGTHQPREQHVVTQHLQVTILNAKIPSTPFVIEKILYKS